MSTVQVVPWRSLTSWTLPSTTLTTGGWTTVRLAEVLTPLVPPVRHIQPGETVRFAGVRWYGRGLFVREERPAEQVEAKCYPVVPGALIYNRLFAWKSAFDIVPDEMLGVVVSNEFPQFQVNRQVAVPQFVKLLCGSPAFAQLMLARSTGSTAVSRNRLHTGDLLDLEIPLPDLQTQRQIVTDVDDRMRQATGLIAAAARTRDAASQAFADALGVPHQMSSANGALVSVARFAQLSRWDVELAVESVSSTYPTSVLAAHAQIRLGCQIPKRGANPSGIERPYLRAANVRRGHLDLSDVKTMRVGHRQADTLTLQNDDVVFLEGSGSVSEVGRCVVWNGEIADCIHQNSVVRARIVSGLLDPRFAVAWFNSDTGSAYFRKQATTTSGLFHIGSGKTAQAPIPIPPLCDQRRLAEAYWSAIATADADESEARSLETLAARELATAAFGEEAATELNQEIAAPSE